MVDEVDGKRDRKDYMRRYMAERRAKQRTSEVSQAEASTTSKNPGGRPSSYDQDVAFKFCDLIANGMAVRKAAEQPGMPSLVTFYKWLKEHPELDVAFHCAMRVKLDAMSEDLLEIADRKIEQDGFDRDAMISVRQWLLAKHWPQKFGNFTAMPAPPPAEPTRSIEDARVIDARPADDPLMQAHENFVRALQERGREDRALREQAAREWAREHPSKATELAAKAKD